jgi:hypothetical protein
MIIEEKVLEGKRYMKKKEVSMERLEEMIKMMI